MTSICSCILVFVLIPIASAAELPSGDEIVRRVNARDEGQAVARTLAMQLIDRHGNVRVRHTRGFRKYYGQEKRTVLFYQRPKRLKDIALLTFDYPQTGQVDDQWLYLPAMRKVRRIAVADRGEAFLGTDLTYEDMKKETKVGREDYTWKTIRRETVEGRACYVVEAIPVNTAIAKELGYGRVLLRIDAEMWMIRKADYWDTHGQLLKTSLISDIRLIQGIWTSHVITVRNHQTGHQTIFTFSEVDYDHSISDDLFTQRALRHGL